MQLTTDVIQRQGQELDLMSGHPRKYSIEIKTYAHKELKAPIKNWQPLYILSVSD
jgi:hypothetical protein